MMVLQTLVLAALIFAPASSPASQASSDDLVFQAGPATPEADSEISRQVFVEPSIARDIAQHPDAQITTVSDGEAVARARESGIALKPWGHPWVIIKAGIGVPGNVNAQVEIYVHQNWSFEVGAGTGLLGTYYNGTVRWHPDATTWNWYSVDKSTGQVSSENSVQLGWGVEVGGAPSGPWGAGNVGVLYLAPTLDAQYIHRFAEHFGWTIGAKLGFGPAFSLVPQEQQSTPPNGSPGSPNSVPTPPTPGTGNPPGPTGPNQLRTDLTMTLLIYTGFTF